MPIETPSMDAASPAATGSRAERLKKKLTDAFAPLSLIIEDESARHAGHQGATAVGESHYKVSIISDKFAGLNRVERSRMVNTILNDEFKTGLHAMSLSLRSPRD